MAQDTADENRRELIAIGGGAKLGSLQSIPFRYYAGNTLFETAYVSLWTRARESARRGEEEERRGTSDETARETRAEREREREKDSVEERREVKRERRRWGIGGGRGVREASTTFRGPHTDRSSRTYREREREAERALPPSKTDLSSSFGKIRVENSSNPFRNLGERVERKKSPVFETLDFETEFRIVDDARIDRNESSSSSRLIIIPEIRTRSKRTSIKFFFPLIPDD